jgi:hypothetical protein
MEARTSRRILVLVPNTDYFVLIPPCFSKWTHAHDHQHTAARCIVVLIPTRNGPHVRQYSFAGFG